MALGEDKYYAWNYLSDAFPCTYIKILYSFTEWHLLYLRTMLHIWCAFSGCKMLTLYDAKAFSSNKLLCHLKECVVS